MGAIGNLEGLLLLLVPVQRLLVVVVIALAVVVVVIAQVLGSPQARTATCGSPRCRAGASSSKGRKPTGSPDA